MADPKSDAHRADLELEVGTGKQVELRHLVSASSTFSGLINEVAEAYTQVRRPVRWVVEVEPGSVKLPIQADPLAEGIHSGQAHAIGSVIADGLAQLEKSPERPEHFTDKALEQAKSLGNLLSEDLPIAVSNGKGRVKLSRQLAINAEKALGRTRESFGTIEGTLESLSIRNANEFGIWQPDGRYVKCLFGRFLTLEDVRPAVGKRVAARGRIKTRPSGERVSVEVHELRVIGSDPIAADEVRGIFRDREVADW